MNDKIILMIFCVLTILTNVCCMSLKANGKFHGSGSSVDHDMGFTDNSQCNTLQPESLAQILGPAYNPRYMSVIPPQDELQEMNQAKENVTKRKTSEYRQFFVDDDFNKELDDKPAWEIDHFVNGQPSLYSESRAKRAAPGSRPWECRAIVKWIDLGSDYFPRYLRTVECTKHDCWYGKFMCKARSFTVKLLRRKRGKCVYHDRKEGVAGLPRELMELWVWEERAVNFCCDCSAR